MVALPPALCILGIVGMLDAATAWTLQTPAMQLEGSSCGPTSVTVSNELSVSTYQVSSIGGDSSGMGTTVDDPSAKLVSCSVGVSSSAVTLLKVYSVSGNLAVHMNETFAVQGNKIAATARLDELQSTAPVSFSVSTGFVVAGSDRLQFWAPWDRESFTAKGATYVDPFNPSDGHLGFWDGMLTLGHVGPVAVDMVVAGAVMVMNSTLAAGHTAEPSGTAFGLALGPGDNPCEVDMLSSAAGSLMFRRSTLRFGQGVATTVLTYDLLPLAPDWRSLMQTLAHTAPHSQYWQPAIGRDASLDRLSGLGTYSWWLGQPNSSIAAQGVKVGWDLGGRFFPYMGMFLPPVETLTTQWLNDAEGSQPRANVTLNEIALYYSSMSRANVTQLSYFNVNEFGTNVKYTPPSPQRSALPGVSQPPSSKQTMATAWSNSSQVIASAFPTGPLWDSFTVSHSRIRDAAVSTWQGGIVLDSGDEQYAQFLYDQMDAHISNLSDSFQGIVIDRSDHMSRYNVLADDGYSLISGTVVRSLRSSYQAVTQHLRQQLGPDRAMMLNGYGNARVDMFQPFDGIFSEGYAVNAGGMLGIVCPSILWVYTLDECCSNETVTLRFFHRHLHTNVLPMAPFPGNDHSIPYSEAGQQIFSAWSPVIRATTAGRTPSLVPFACAVAGAAPAPPAPGSGPLVKDGDPLVSCSTGKQAAAQTHVVTALRYGESTGSDVSVVVYRLDEILACPPASDAHVESATTPKLESLDVGTGLWVPFTGTVKWFAATGAAVDIQLVDGFGVGAVRFSCP